MDILAELRKEFESIAEAKIKIVESETRIELLRICAELGIPADGKNGKLGQIGDKRGKDEGEERQKRLEKCMHSARDWIGEHIRVDEGSFFEQWSDSQISEYAAFMCNNPDGASAKEVSEFLRDQGIEDTGEFGASERAVRTHTEQGHYLNLGTESRKRICPKSVVLRLCQKRGQLTDAGLLAYRSMVGKKP